MRGSERPGKVPWTHPCLPALQPLSDKAAQQIFVDITDNFYEGENIAQLLQLTDNMPLAVDLIAHLADYEGFSNVLVRWETEKTTVLSIGYDQRSNLDISIQLSLSSPRITFESKELLSLLSILPDGLSDVELVQSNLPIANILACKATLLATSLAYQDANKRLRSLMPIRDHIQQFLPPSYFLTQSLREYFYSVLELYKKYKNEQRYLLVNQIASNLGNLQNMLQLGLKRGDLNLLDTIYCAISLNSFYRVTGQGHTPLMYTIPMSFPQPTDHQLEARFFMELILFKMHTAIMNPEIVISRVLSHLQHFTDPALECESQIVFLLILSKCPKPGKFYIIAGGYHLDHKMDPACSLQFLNKAHQLANLCGDRNLQFDVSLMIAQLQWHIGDHCTAILYASKAQRQSKLCGNLCQEAEACRVMAMCTGSVGNWQKSMTNLHRAKEILSLCGLSGGYSDRRISFNQAEAHLIKSEYAQAKAIYNHMVKTMLPEQNAYVYACALLNIAEINIMIGHPTGTEEVCQNLSRAREVFKDLNLLAEITFCDMLWTDMEFKEGKLDLAKVKFSQYINAARGKNNQIMSFCLERVADVNAWQNIESQSIWPVINLAYAYKTKQKLALHKALLFLGDVLIFHEDEDTAQNLWMVALEGFTYMDVHRSQGQSMLRLGDLAKKRGQILTAIEFWKSARPLFEQSSQAKDMAQIDSRLAAVEESHQGTLDKLTELHPCFWLLQQLSIPEEDKCGVEEVEEDSIDTDVGEEILPIVM